MSPVFQAGGAKALSIWDIEGAGRNQCTKLNGDRSNVGLLLELNSTIKAVRKQLDVFKHKNDSNCYWRMNYKGEGR